MKLSGRRAEAFVERPDPAVRAALLYGADAGLIAERARALTLAVVENASDPFRITELAGAAIEREPARLSDEAAALAFLGGRRVVRVRDGGDGLAPLFARWFADSVGEALVIVEAGELRPRSALRRLFEETPDAAALPCYPDEGGALDRLIDDALRNFGLAIDADARAYLGQRLGGDRGVSRRELDKLALYVAAGGNGERSVAITLDDVRACVGDSTTIGLEDLAMAVADGDPRALDRLMARSTLEAAAPVALLRATARHFQRLHRASGARDTGASEKRAVSDLKPPLFFRHVEAVIDQLRRWQTPAINDALEIISETELLCKSTGVPARAACGQALLRVAALAPHGTR